MSLGKVWELAQLERRTARAAPYDLTIVDAPATGHGLALLRAPRTYAEIARVGPIRNHANRIHEFVTDPARTAVVAVALAEEMPVNETIDLQERLRDQLGVELAAVLVNGVLPERFSGPRPRPWPRSTAPAPRRRGRPWRRPWPPTSAAAPSAPRWRACGGRSRRRSPRCRSS